MVKVLLLLLLLLLHGFHTLDCEHSGDLLHRKCAGRRCGTVGEGRRLCKEGCRIDEQRCGVFRAGGWG